MYDFLEELQEILETVYVEVSQYGVAGVTTQELERLAELIDEEIRRRSSDEDGSL